MRTLASMHRLFKTSNVPGVAQSKYETQDLIGIAKFVPVLENNLDSELICAWISRLTIRFHLFWLNFS